MTIVNDDNKDHAGSGEVNQGFTNEEPKRRVSIASDAVQADVERQRKISQVSNSDSHQSHRKSILINGERQHFVDPTFVRTLAHLHGAEDKHHTHPEHMAYSTHDGAQSWWFLLCTKCRQKETGPGWEPSFWQSICPYPFCPTYRHIARIISLFLLGLLVWGVVYCVIGKDAAPGGQLFDIALLCIAANFGGWVFRMINFPGLIGMLMVGVIFQNTGMINVHGTYVPFVSILRKIALVVILTRAGLDLDPPAMKRLFWTVLRLGLVPWFVECAFAALFGHYLLGLPWMWAILMGGIIGAVSPAVVVPCLFRLRTKGYGVAKGIPTMVIAVSGIDDAASVAAFGIIHSIMFSEHSLVYTILLGAFSVVLGVGFGIFWGLMSLYVPEKGDPFAVPLRILMLLGGGLIAVFGSEMVELGGAGPLGVVAAAFVSSWVWSTQGWDIDDNPVATAFEIFWMLFEPILFSLTGTQIKIAELDPNTFLTGFICLSIGAIIRILVTVLIAIKASLNLKEKFCCAFSWMAKASVQAALGPVAIDTVRNYASDSPEKQYAEIILMICVTSIILTAPVGAIIITFLGPKLLTKTVPGPPSGWRRSARPSLRDISIIEEDEEIGTKSQVHHRHHKDNDHPAPPPNIIITSQPN